MSEQYLVALESSPDATAAEKALVRAVSVETVQKNAIVLLGLRKSPDAIMALIHAYKKPPLRRLVLFALGEIVDGPAVLMGIAKDPTHYLHALARQIVEKMRGAPKKNAPVSPGSVSPAPGGFEWIG